MLPPSSGPLSRLQANWVYGGVLAGVLLLVLAPVMVGGWSRPDILAFLALPAYMLHQFEEHDDDRFRRFVNTVLGHGRELLTVSDVFWINIVGVWLSLALCIWATRWIDPGWGVFAGWFILVNGLAHAGQGLALRRPNPGLWTGLVLFFPLGLAIMATAGPLASRTQQLVALGLVIAIHAGIIAMVRSRLRAAA